MRGMPKTPTIVQDGTQRAQDAANLPAEHQHANAGIGRSLNDINVELRERRAEEREKARQAALRAVLAPKFTAPSKMGRPTVYDNETMPNRVYDMLSRTDVIFTQKLVAAHLSVNVSTLKDWKGIYPDLAAAIAQGLAVQEAYLGTLMAGGMKYSASVYAVLKNLHDWSDKIDQRTTVDLTEAIRKQAMGAKRVAWDKALPDPIGEAKRAQPTHVLGGGAGHADPAPQSGAPAPTAAPVPAPVQPSSMAQQGDTSSSTPLSTQG